MTLDLHGGPGGVHTVLEVFAMGEGGVLEARAGQRGTGLYARVEARLRHEQVVVARLGVNVPCLALDQVTQHIVGHPPTQTT
ncbi:hypothetical protein D3C75_1125020 [compost metagenome]